MTPARHHTLAALFATALVACGAAEATPDAADAAVDGSLMDGPVVPDASRPPDAATTDGGDDGSVPPVVPDDAAVPEDGGDARVPDDAGLDCASCAPTSPCDVAECIEGVCIHQAVTDGSSCGEGDLQLCVRGACVQRGCGDGYREPGPDARREGCDDGNLVDGDGCDASCIARPFVLESGGENAPTAYPTAQGSFAAVDGLGNVIFVWTSTVDGQKVVRLRRVAGPLASEAPATLDVSMPTSGEPEPVAVGLPDGGFLVAWSAKSNGGTRIAVRALTADGTMLDARVLPQSGAGLRTSPRLSAVGDGAVLVLRDSALGIRARRLSASGAVLGEEIAVSASPADQLDTPRVAAVNDAWIATWRRRPASDKTTARLLARRYRGASPLDIAPLELADDVSSASVATMDDAFVVAWASGHEDGLGNVYALPIDVEGALDPDARVDVAVDATHADVEPSVVGFGPQAYVVVWLQGELGLPAIYFSDTRDLQELSVLLERWALGAEGNLSLARARSGAWVAWRGVDSGSLRSTASAFFLPDS